MDELQSIVAGLELMVERANDLHARIEYAEIREVRGEAIAWARRILADPAVVILDSETTGIDGDVDFLQLAVIDRAGETLFNRRVRPAESVEREYQDGQGTYRPQPWEPIEISDGAYAVHGIKAEDLEGESTFSEVWPELQKVLEGKRVVVYNSNYDLDVLKQVRHRYDLGEAGIKESECAMLAYAKYVAQWSPYRRSWTWHRLPDAEHGALADCRATLAVIRRMASESPDEVRVRTAKEEYEARVAQKTRELIESGEEGSEEDLRVLAKDLIKSDFESIPF